MVVIIVDTLRADHVYGKRARTPNIDALARDGLSFTRFHPEAMPTVPARRSILTGRRAFPFRGWHPYSGLLAEPGWAPIANLETTFTSALRRAGYWTAYATDNTSLGFSGPYGPFRRSFDVFKRRGGRSAGAPTGSRRRSFATGCPRRSTTRTCATACAAIWPTAATRTTRRAPSPLVFRDATAILERAAARHRPFALVVDTFEPHEPWTPPRRYVDLYGDPDYRGPEPARPYYAPVSRYLDGPDLVLVDRMKALYAAEVTMTDRWLGVFLDRLHGLRLERDTVVVLVSDHGIYLGDHGYTGKTAGLLHPRSSACRSSWPTRAGAAPARPAAGSRRPTTWVPPFCRWPAFQSRAAWTASTCRACSRGAGRRSATTRGAATATAGTSTPIAGLRSAPTTGRDHGSTTGVVIPANAEMWPRLARARRAAWSGSCAAGPALCPPTPTDARSLH